MGVRRSAVWIAVLMAPAGFVRAADDAVEPNLATRATDVLRKYCYKCHGVEYKVPAYNVLDRESLVAKRGDDDPPYVTPGKPDQSAMWDRMGPDEPQSGDRMPPKGPRPNRDELELVRRWIVAGAPSPAKVADRAFVSDEAVLRAVVEHARGLDSADAKFWRYFTLETLHNNPKVRDDQLRLARAALSKLLNSLSRRPIVVPEAIGPGQTVLAVDIRRLGWAGREVWTDVLRAYPYGLKFDRRREPGLKRLAEDVERVFGDDVGLPSVRADWFIDQASRPPLYHQVLGLPDTAEALEHSLGVDVEADFQNSALKRAAFARSGISRQNRLVDRHEGERGYYWKSYDFRHDDGTSNLFRFPLGPVFPGNPFPRHAFEHAGGEIVFTLPNDLQGYLLVDDKGKRIDAGPPDVVGDENKVSGTTLIVNGLSCIGCHREGMKPFTDELRAGAAVEGKARAKLESLVPEARVWAQVLSDDRARYLKAEEAATGPFLKVGEDRSKSLSEFPEPVSAVAHLLYQKELGPEELAAELGLSDRKDALSLIGANANLRRLGLAVLLNGGAVKRADWESLRGRAISTFHQAAIELQRGTPYRKF